MGALLPIGIEHFLSLLYSKSYYTAAEQTDICDTAIVVRIWALRTTIYSLFIRKYSVARVAIGAVLRNHGADKFVPFIRASSKSKCLNSPSTLRHRTFLLCITEALLSATTLCNVLLTAVMGSTIKVGFYTTLQSLQFFY